MRAVSGAAHAVIFGAHPERNERFNPTRHDTRVDVGERPTKLAAGWCDRQMDTVVCLTRHTHRRDDWH
jgi:hypothetical protein